MRKKSIKPTSGWILISQDVDGEGNRTDWYIAWDSVFGTKKAALKFAKKYDWPPPYKAVRGQITVQHP
jgi:hypothetical protein